MQRCRQVTEFQRISKMLQQDKPSIPLNRMKETPDLAPLFALKGCEQSPDYHPEGDVWIHTMHMVDHMAALKLPADQSLKMMWAALLHDIAKPDTWAIRKDRITNYNHDIAGRKKACQLLIRLGAPQEFAEEVAAIVRWHMQPYFVSKGYAKMDRMLQEVDAEDICAINFCDRLSKGSTRIQDITAAQTACHAFLEACRLSGQTAR